MTQDKMRKLITAGVVAATALLVLLLSVLVYQWIKIGVYNSKIEKLEAENATLEQQAQEGEANAAYYEGPGQFWLAIEKGWVESQKGE